MSQVILILGGTEIDKGKSFHHKKSSFDRGCRYCWNVDV